MVLVCVIASDERDPGGVVALATPPHLLLPVSISSMQSMRQNPDLWQGEENYQLIG